MWFSKKFLIKKNITDQEIAVIIKFLIIGVLPMEIMETVQFGNRNGN